MDDEKRRGCCFAVEERILCEVPPIWPAVCRINVPIERCH
jgi:hypothetical protein